MSGNGQRLHVLESPGVGFGKSEFAQPFINKAVSRHASKIQIRLQPLSIKPGEVNTDLTHAFDSRVPEAQLEAYKNLR